MTFNAQTLLWGAIGVAFFAIVFLIAFIVHEASENRRLKAQQAPEAMPESKGDPAAPDSMERGGIYSYSSIVMDEVLGEKIIEGLKESLRMMEEIYKQLSEQYKDDRDKRIELASDWLNYLEAIDNIKQARIDYRMNSTDGESSKTDKESARVKLEIEDKFKNLQEAIPAPMAGN